MAIHSQQYSVNIENLSGIWRNTPQFISFFAALTCIAPLLFVLSVSQTHAESLNDAMVAAYKRNLLLQAERFKARASDEGVARALSGYRPKVTAFGNYRVSSEGGGGLDGFDNGSVGYGVRLDQPLFDGFKTQSSVDEAESNVHVARNDLLARENSILFETARAYLEVLRDEGILLLRKRNVTSLRRELIGTRDRYDRGQGTVTDVEQVKIRLAASRSALKAAEAQLQTSQLRYARVTRKPPEHLKMPKFPEILMPKTLTEAVKLANEANPEVAAAHHRSEAALHAVEKQRADFLPKADLSAGYSSEDDVSFNDVISNNGEEDNFFVRAQINIPLYQGGEVSARVREASHIAESLERSKRDTEVRMAEAVGSVWAQLKAARQRRLSDQEAVIASEKALEGIREELRIGQRTVMDLLDADKELVESRIRLLGTKRDLHVSAYELLNAMGILTVDRIDPSVQRYDPKAYYQKVRNKLWGSDTPKTGDEDYLGQSYLKNTQSSAIK
ncbi:MAG: TolC family outer membrane protein [Pseudomonadota bacterium]